MTILQALNAYYDRMAARGEAEAPGWSREKFGWCIIIDAEGAPVDVQDLRDNTGKKPVPTLREVPAAFVRPGVTPRAFTMWDKTAFALGVTKAVTGGGWTYTPKQLASFQTLHRTLLSDSDDDGLVALLCFANDWVPERFGLPPFSSDMLDANIMFRLDGDGQRFIHQRPAAKALIERAARSDGATAFCLVTGADLPVARLHPSIKGVEGAQTAGASLVSFNLDAFTSYGAEQGDNAPTSQAAAFRYGAALNRLLDRGSRNRLRIGDATVVFWADASDAVPEAADVAEAIFGAMFAPPPVEDAAEAAKLRIALEAVRQGRPVAALDPCLATDVRFHVLGLSPNAARLSVRYWLSDDFTVFARRLADHYADLAIEPSPWRREPSIDWLLRNSTALQGERGRIPAQLAGEVTRAILEGRRYPRTLLAAALMRLRAGDDPLGGFHVAAIRAVLARDHRLGLLPEETPVSLDRAQTNIAYQLGRLFAVLETAQRMALGRVNATIRDRYFGAASATPAGVFPLLLRGAQNHLGKLRKEGKGGWLEREIEDILGILSLDLPRSLPLVEQGRFAIGYYHQRKTQFAGRPDADPDATDTDAEGKNA